MRLAIINETKREATYSDLEALAHVIETQTLDYAGFWQSGGVAVEAFRNLADVPADATIIALLETADEADVLGYHDTTPDGRPYGRVFLGPIFDNGGSWTKGGLSVSQTLSHEALEAIGDPYANWWADDNGYEKAIELCDLVESDTYEIGGIAVSNFLGPRAFGKSGRLHPGEAWDFMGTLKDLSHPRPDCYEIRRAISGTSYPVFGASYPEWKKDMKAMRKGRTAERLGLYRDEEHMVMGDDVPDEHAAELRRLIRRARGIAESQAPQACEFAERRDTMAAPSKPRVLYNGTLMSLVGKR